MRKNYLLILALSSVALAGCQSSGGDAPDLGFCGLNCPPNDPNGNGNGDPDDGGDTTTGGNTTDLSSGDTTLALEAGVLVSPSSGSLSKLTETAGAKGAANTAKIEIDTKTDTNGAWPEPKAMDEYVEGTNEPSFNNMGNLGAKQYREYRAIGQTATATTDEELQVWHWNNSYATQYRNVGESGDAANQAVSYGGNKTAVSELPKNGTASFSGTYGSTMTSSNWIKPDGGSNTKVIDPNGPWQNSGAANLTADFTNGTVKGTLAPKIVRYFDKEANQFLYYNVANNQLFAKAADGTPIRIRKQIIAPGFLATAVSIDATMKGADYSGTAKLGDGFVSGNNPAKGSFFGKGGSETTGIFNVKGVKPQPTGGETPLGDDRRGYLDVTGVFHACKPKCK